MDQVQERIAAWEAAGLIDAATADRLRLAEAEAPPARASAVEQGVVAGSPARRGPSSVAAVFGPGVTIGEMFAYLGGGFLLGAYETFVVRLAGSPEGTTWLPIAIGSAIAAVVLAVFGMALMNGDARRRRAAGVTFVLAVAHAGAGASALAAVTDMGWPTIGVVGSLAATVVAIGLRLRHAALLTQFAVLASITCLASVFLSWIEQAAFLPQRLNDLGQPILEGAPNMVVVVLVSAAWWLVIAVVIGLLGLREATSADWDAAAGRRAPLTRLWAGLTAVIGLASSVTRSAYTTYPGVGSDGYSSAGEYGRIIEPFVGDLAILVLAAILVERAFRRDASTFVYAAALGLMIALSDFNFSYLSSSTEIGLLLEGVILIGAGVAADRLRRRIGRDGPEVAIPVATA